jgi:hypothetical protein
LGLHVPKLSKRYTIHGIIKTSLYKRARNREHSMYAIAD